MSEVRELVGTYRGRSLADPFHSYGTTFSTIHRELFRISMAMSSWCNWLQRASRDGPLQLPRRVACNR
jgi:hypothetical protein